MKTTPNVVKQLLTRKEPGMLTGKDYVSTGSTLLNLACSDRAFGGFAKGHYYHLVGDSNTGKTFLSLTCFAEAAINKNFDDYTLEFDNAENGALMDFSRFFGEKAAKRIRVTQSTTLEEFYYKLDSQMDKGPIIKVLDSLDVLVAGAEKKKFKQAKKAALENTEAKGSYGTQKAKMNSELLRQTVAKVHETGSILIIISQTRESLGFGFDTKTYSGGKAPKFYATLQLWSSLRKVLKKKVRDKDRQVGILSQIKIKKNRQTGKEWTINVPIYWSFGIDDIGSCVDYLVEESHWKRSKQGIDAKEMEFTGNKEALVRFIEENNKQKLLRLTVAQVWEDITQACAIQRQPRY